MYSLKFLQESNLEDSSSGDSDMVLHEVKVPLSSQVQVVVCGDDKVVRYDEALSRRSLTVLCSFFTALFFVEYRSSFLKVIFTLFGIRRAFT